MIIKNEQQITKRYWKNNSNRITLFSNNNNINRINNNNSNINKINNNNDINKAPITSKISEIIFRVGRRRCQRLQDDLGLLPRGRPDAQKVKFTVQNVGVILRGAETVVEPVSRLRRFGDGSTQRGERIPGRRINWCWQWIKN